MGQISWEDYNGMNGLIERAERYKEEREYYPKQICANAIYMTVANKKFCEDRGIPLSGRARKQEVAEI